MNTLFNLVFGGCDMDMLNTVQFMQSYSINSQKIKSDEHFEIPFKRTLTHQVITVKILKKMRKK